MGQEGNTWYKVQTIRDVVQMCGRGMRHADDWCHTYIIDSQFAKNLYGKNKSLFPDWFREAVDTRSDFRWMRRPK
jgi:Rad3-related DNA helicases